MARPEAKLQRNFTGPDVHIMPNGSFGMDLGPSSEGDDHALAVIFQARPRVLLPVLCS